MKTVKLYEITASNNKIYRIKATSPNNAKAKLYDNYGALTALMISRGKPVLPKGILYDCATFRKFDLIAAAKKLKNKFAADFNIVTLDSGQFALECIGVLEGAA